MLKRLSRVATTIAVILGMSLIAVGASASPTKVSVSPTTKGACCIETQVSIPADGYVIPGTFTTPKAGGAHARYPAVLLLHGTASQKDEVGNMYLRLAQQLGAKGYASLRIDFAGSGDSLLPETAFTYTEEVSDARTALTWLGHQTKVNADALGVVGFSQGGRVAATLAGTDGQVKALATWSTWVEDGATAYLLYGEDAYNTAQRDGTVTVDLGFRTWTYSLDFFESIRKSHPLQDIAAYHGPLLGIDGSDDELWPQTKQELYAAGSYDETLHVVPGADHIYHVLTDDQSQAEDVLTTTADWFATTLAPDVRHGH